MVWSLFSLYHKNEWLSPPLSLNKGGPFGFHNSSHLTPSWNGHLGSRDFLLCHRGARAWFGGLASPTAASANASVLCCAVYGAIIHSEDNTGPASLLTGWPFHFTALWHPVETVMETRSRGTPHSCSHPGKKLERGGSWRPGVFFFFMISKNRYFRIVSTPMIY